MLLFYNHIIHIPMHQVIYLVYKYIVIFIYPKLKKNTE